MCGINDLRRQGTANARMNLSRQRTVVRLRLDVPQRVLCTPIGVAPLINRCDLYRLSFVLRQGAAERHAN
jgi:hypothetical protein